MPPRTTMPPGTSHASSTQDVRVAAFEGVKPPETFSSLDRPKPTTNEDIFEESIILPFSGQVHALAKPDTTEPKPSVAHEPVTERDRNQAMEDLLQFSDSDFVAILHACQPQIVLLALSGATRAFVRRVERLMPSKDVKRLRERLNKLGPIQLRDVDAAHMQVVETAMKLLASGVVGATTTVSFTAAA